MSAVIEFVTHLIAKIFGVLIDKFRKPEPLPPVQPPPPVVIINVVSQGETQSTSEANNTDETEPSVIEGVIPIVLPPDTTLTEGTKPETFTDEYWETLAVDLTKKVRPRDRLVLRDKRYTEPKQ